MTKAEYRKRYNAVLKRTVKMLRTYREASLKSGAVIPKQDTEAPFRLPINVMCAGLKECQDQWRPASKASKKEIETIYRQTFLS